MRSDGNEESNDSAPQSENVIAIGVLLMVAIVAIPVVSAYIYNFGKLPWEKDEAIWGQFGDYIGGILNPLIAVLALLTLVLSYRTQKRELKVTQKALREQAVTSEQARKEQRFFDLLNLYLKTLESVRYVTYLREGPLLRDNIAELITGKRAVFEGKEAILEFMERELNHPHASDSNSNESERLPYRDTDLKELYATLIHNSDYFSHYLRVVYNIAKYCDENLGDDKFRYMNLFRAQLSKSELRLLAINGLDSEGLQMHAYFEKFGLLKHLEDESLKEALLQKFSKPAWFGRNFSRHPSS